MTLCIRLRTLGILKKNILIEAVVFTLIWYIWKYKNMALFATSKAQIDEIVDLIKKSMRLIGFVVGNLQ